MKHQIKQKIIVQNNADDCGKIVTFLKNNLESINLPDEVVHDLRLVLEETFINIVNYAYKNKERSSISIELGIDEQQIQLTFIDTGFAFNPLTDGNKNIDDNDNCDGGMGIHIIKSLTDSQDYKRIDERNVFTVTKNYTQDN